MQTHAFRDKPDEQECFDEESLIETISSLRNDVSTMMVSMRQMLRENMKLKQELSAYDEVDCDHAETNDEEGGMARLNRVRREVDLLTRLYGSAKPNRRSRARVPVQREPVVAPSRSPDRGNWLRTMMMVMMMSELM